MFNRDVYCFLTRQFDQIQDNQLQELAQRAQKLPGLEPLPECTGIPILEPTKDSIENKIENSIEKEKTERKIKRWSFIDKKHWLLIGLILMLFRNRKWITTLLKI